MNRAIAIALTLVGLAVPHAMAGPASKGVDEPASGVVVLAEGFDDIQTIYRSGWVQANSSLPPGTVLRQNAWRQGSTAFFPAQAGPPTSYLSVNIDSVDGLGTISNWLLSPELTLHNGDVIEFYTRTRNPELVPDRLQVWLSAAGPSTNVGATARSTGDFVTLLADINSGYDWQVVHQTFGTVAGYPAAWTRYSLTVSGVRDGQTGRIGFRFFILNGNGERGDLVAIDSFRYLTNIPTPGAAAALAAIGAGAILRRKRR
jgi:hypothetical protein